MILSSLVCCENIIQEPNNNRTHLVNPLQVIKLMNVPSTYSFSVSIGLVKVDKKGNDVISIKIENEKEEVVNEISSINFPVPPEGAIMSKAPYAITVNFDVRNMVFNSLGTYKIRVIDESDKAELGTVSFEVVK